MIYFWELKIGITNLKTVLDYTCMFANRVAGRLVERRNVCSVAVKMTSSTSEVEKKCKKMNFLNIAQSEKLLCYLPWNRGVQSVDRNPIKLFEWAILISK